MAFSIFPSICFSMDEAREGLYYTDAYDNYVVIITPDGDTSYLFHWSGKLFEPLTTFLTRYVPYCTRAGWYFDIEIICDMEKILNAW